MQTLRYPQENRRFAAHGLSGRFSNYARTTLLLGGLTALVVVVADHLGGAGFAALALAVMAAVNFATWWWSDKLVTVMHGARPLSRAEAPEVHAIVGRLAARAGVPAPRLYWVPERAPNAFATGRNPANAVVAVTAGALELLNESELEGVLAHELAHVLNRDTLVSTIAATMAGAISFVARMAGFAFMLGGNRGSDEEDHNPVASLLLIILAPIIALLVQLAVSRTREYGADATGAQLVGSGRGLASALAKLHGWSQRVPMHSADLATSHMYIVQPALGIGSSMAALFRTHPPVEERIRRLQQQEIR